MCNFVFNFDRVFQQLFHSNIGEEELQNMDCRLIFHCRTLQMIHYHAQKIEPAEIVEDLARDISRGIELTCSCRFPSNYIIDRELKCDKENLIFSGRIISTNERNSTNLLADFKKWLLSNPTIIVKGETLNIVNRSNNNKSNELSMQEKFSEDYLIMVVIGGIVAVLILLLVVIIGTAVVWHKHRFVSNLYLQRK